ncbi:hypothetical protein BCR43DRAFT_480028 [Syncephalastrum racemosum]|uniref:Kinase-like domain-containing protein n=1 Tax=Syncephalastrum racemosum TaxID=13706 RepID=A0A1X2H1D9_SYNRA|nr:hypothetical protein BCR43DRAFT_480028 [Syncephalastrum racemosum]
MFKQTRVPSEDELRNALGEDYADRWDHTRVSDWLQEKGWPHIAPIFKEHGMCGRHFFQTTLAQLVEILPRPITTYAERRRLLNDIRQLVLPAASSPRFAVAAPPTHISINTNIHNSSYTSSAPVDTQNCSSTPTSAHLAGISPSTPLSASRCDCHAATTSTTATTSSNNNNNNSTATASGLRSSRSPCSSPSSSEFPISCSPRHYNRPSPTRQAFSKIRNTFFSSTSPSSALSGSRSSSTTTRSTDVDDDPAEKQSSSRLASTPDKLTRFWQAWRTPTTTTATTTTTITTPTIAAINTTPPPPGRTTTHTTRSRTSSAKAVARVMRGDPDVQKRFFEQRIQVTADKETWYSLVVTDITDPDTLKDLILKRMNFDGHRTEYCYFHENGPDTDTELMSEDIAYICSMADHAATQRILVKPLDECIRRSYYPAQQPQQRSTLRRAWEAYTTTDYTKTSSFLYGNSVYSLSTPELGHSPGETPLTPYGATQHSPVSPTRKSNGYNKQPQNSQSFIGIQLSDPPLSPQNTPLSDDDGYTAVSACPLPPPHVYQQRKGSVPLIYESSPHRLADKSHVRRSEPCLNQPSSTRPLAQLWAVPPVHPLQPAEHDVAESPIALENRIEHSFWGERPPAEVVCQNMDRYFDNHDLDKEIEIEPLTPQQHQQPQPPQQPQQQPPRRLNITKSIRVVAREASHRYHRKPSNVCRRKSTKLWGQRVVEVKPAHVSYRNDEQGDGKPVQWIRGKLIGKGSFGRVYLAFNVGTGEVIAVKQVEMPRTKSDLLNKTQRDMIDALYQEIALLRDLDHNHIVQYLGYGRDDEEGVINIFLEYVSGGSIASRLALQGAFDESLARHFTRQICEGLAYLHSKNILHRDIKAANILVEEDGVCKISDFGLSKKNDYSEVYDPNSRMSLRGSIYWMAPEVVKNESYSAKVDIWSLGCTVIEMFTGQRPWLEVNQIAALYNLGCHKSPDIPEMISPDAKDFLQRCFLIDPSERPTAAELLQHPFCQSDPRLQFEDYVIEGKI